MAVYKLSLLHAHAIMSEWNSWY